MVGLNLSMKIPTPGPSTTSSLPPPTPQLTKQHQHHPPDQQSPLRYLSCYFMYGPNNQLTQLRECLTLSMRLKRILILPDFLRSHFEDFDSPDFVPLSSFVDVEALTSSGYAVTISDANKNFLVRGKGLLPLLLDGLLLEPDHVRKDHPANIKAAIQADAASCFLQMACFEPGRVRLSEN